MRKCNGLPRRPNGALLLFFVFLLLFAGPAWSLTLQEAKSKGWVGEQANGYVGIVQPGVSADVKALVNDINAKRKAKYQGIAQRNNTSLQAVEVLAGKKAMEKTPSGQYIKPPSTGWVKK